MSRKVKTEADDGGERKEGTEMIQCTQEKEVKELCLSGNYIAENHVWIERA
jgi:hypothetical protein